ncbi:MAG: TonB-dependent receptor [Vulcanimicrobiaceae bacterium]
MFATIVLATMLGLSSHPLTVVDQAGKPVAGATVVFSDAGGNRDAERTDASGRVAARSGFTPIRVQIAAAGFAPVTLLLEASPDRIVLGRALPVIGSVRVATGSLQSLHALPVAASLLDRTALANTGTTTSDSALRILPGFDRTRSNSAFTNYGQLRISFNGAGNDRGLMLVDGVPAQDGFGGQIDWAAYPAPTLERAELLRGAGSALYGAGAIGGVLDVTTFGPNSDPNAAPDGTLTFAAGTHALSQQAVSVRSAIAPNLTASFSSQQQRLEYYDFPPNQRSSVDQIAQSQSSMAAMRLRYSASQASIFEVGALGAWDNQQQGRPNYTFSRRLGQEDARYLHPTAHSLLTASFFDRSAYVINVADQYPTKPGVLRYTQDVPSTESGAGLSWLVDNGTSEFAMRADGRWVRGESDQYNASGTFQNSGGGSQQLGGIAVQETFSGKRFEAVAGARLDTVSFLYGRLVTTGKTGTIERNPPASTDRAVSPRVALRYDFSPHLAVRASAGAGFRPPYLNELVRGYFIGSVQYGPNPSLVPERSATTSAGLDWTNGRGRLSLDAYDTRVNDAIMFRTIDPTHQLRANVAQTRTDGATFTYVQALSQCSRVSFSATAQNARVTQDYPAIVGKQLQFVPDQSATLAYDGHLGSLEVGANLSYLGQTYADDLNLSPLGTAVVLGAHVRIPLAQGAAITVSGDNLTGANYLSSVDRLALPTVVSLGFQLPVGPSQGKTSGGCSP